MAWKFIKVFPKYAFVFGVFSFSTMLFGVWFFFRFSGSNVTASSASHGVATSSSSDSSLGDHALRLLVQNIQDPTQQEVSGKPRLSFEEAEINRLIHLASEDARIAGLIEDANQRAADDFIANPPPEQADETLAEMKARLGLDQIKRTKEHEGGEKKETLEEMKARLLGMTVEETRWNEAKGKDDWEARLERTRKALPPKNESFEMYEARINREIDLKQAAEKQRMTDAINNVLDAEFPAQPDARTIAEAKVYQELAKRKAVNDRQVSKAMKEVLEKTNAENAARRQ